MSRPFQAAITKSHKLGQGWEVVYKQETFDSHGPSWTSKVKAQSGHQLAEVFLSVLPHVTPPLPRAAGGTSPMGLPYKMLTLEGWGPTTQPAPNTVPLRVTPVNADSGEDTHPHNSNQSTQFLERLWFRIFLVLSIHSFFINLFLLSYSIVSILA